ncbi:MAG: GtrA family protein [Chloroflexi bacterium]|nr:GtrA family protein [Chloroflexota bacterium]
MSRRWFDVLPWPARRLIKFGTVGASGVVINEGLLFAGREFLHLPLLVASVIAVECSIITNFLLNDRWTFGRQRPQIQRLLQFNAVSLISLLINVSVLAFLEHVTSLHYLIANPVAILVAFGVNYSLNTYWTYGRAPAHTVDTEHIPQPGEDYRIDLRA